MSEQVIVSIHIPVQNPETDSQFYAQLFGWKLQPHPSGAPLFQLASGVTGAFVKAGEAGYEAGKVVVYVSVDDISATLDRAQTLGGKMLVPYTPMFKDGFGILADPSGNPIGLCDDREQEARCLRT